LIARDAINADMHNLVSDAEYEFAKVNRSRKQAIRSMDAETKAE